MEDLQAIAGVDGSNQSGVPPPALPERCVSITGAGKENVTSIKLEPSDDSGNSSDNDNLHIVGERRGGNPCSGSGESGSGQAGDKIVVSEARRSHSVTLGGGHAATSQLNQGEVNTLLLSGQEYSIVYIGGGRWVSKNDYDLQQGLSGVLKPGTVIPNVAALPGNPANAMMAANAALTNNNNNLTGVGKALSSGGTSPGKQTTDNLSTLNMAGFNDVSATELSDPLKNGNLQAFIQGLNLTHAVNKPGRKRRSAANSRSTAKARASEPAAKFSKAGDSSTAEVRLNNNVPQKEEPLNLSYTKA